MIPDTFSTDRDYGPKHKDFIKNAKLAHQYNTNSPKQIIKIL